MKTLLFLMLMVFAAATAFAQDDDNEPEQVQKPIEETPVVIPTNPIQTPEKKKFRI